jgi:PKD repeat protein
VARTTARVVDLQFGPEGFLYYADFDGGNVYRLAYYPGNTPPIARLTASVLSGPVPLDVTFDASASSDEEDGSNLLFE